MRLDALRSISMCASRIFCTLFASIDDLAFLATNYLFWVFFDESSKHFLETFLAKMKGWECTIGSSMFHNFCARVRHQPFLATVTIGEDSKTHPSTSIPAGSCGLRLDALRSISMCASNARSASFEVISADCVFSAK